MYRSPRKKERKAEKEKKSSRSVELSLFVLFVFSVQQALVVRTLTGDTGSKAVRMQRD